MKNIRTLKEKRRNNAEKRKLLGENALKDFTNKLNYNCFLKEIKKAYGY